MLRCTSTLSITTWKNSGETRANTCRKNDATSTSASKPTVFVNCAEEPGNVEPAREVEEPGAPRHQDETTVPHRLELRRVISTGQGDHGACTSTLSSPTLPEEQNAAVFERGDGRQRRVRATATTSSAPARLEPEARRDPQHFWDTDGRGRRNGGGSARDRRRCLENGATSLEPKALDRLNSVTHLDQHCMRIRQRFDFPCPATRGPASRRSEAQALRLV